MQATWCACCGCRGQWLAVVCRAAEARGQGQYGPAVSTVFMRMKQQHQSHIAVVTRGAAVALCARN